MDNGKASLTSRISYEWADPDDWTEAMSLVWTTFMEFEAADYGEEGVGHFFEFITDDDLHKAFLRGSYPVMVARLDGKIVGVGSVRSGNRRADRQALQISERHLSRKLYDRKSGTLCRGVL